MIKKFLISAAVSFSYILLYAQTDLAKPFTDCGIEVSITLYDYQAKKWIASDINDSHFQTLPASTFKIINTLIALETGVVANEEIIFKWPGTADTVKYGFRPETYHDMNLKEAFSISAVWPYLELSGKIGKARYLKYLNECNYGNGNISDSEADFWNFGNFAVSPVNQIEVLIGIYEETLPFRKENFTIIKSLMIEEQTDNYILRAKTGWARDGGKDTGWWIGYVERDNNVCFFATRLIKNRDKYNPGFSACRKTITKAVLRQMNVID